MHITSHLNPHLHHHPPFTKSPARNTPVLLCTRHTCTYTPLTIGENPNEQPKSRSPLDFFELLHTTTLGGIYRGRWGWLLDGQAKEGWGGGVEEERIKEDRGG